MNYILIFLAKIIEVSLMTLRTVMVTKGEKLYAALIGFVEVMIWLIVVSVVLTGISEDPIKMVAYALGFACGCFFGIMLEEKIGLGTSTIQVITNHEEGLELAELLRQDGKAVTILEGDGRDSKKSVLMMHVKRKEKDIVISKIESLKIGAVITISEAKQVYGGFGVARK